MKIAAALLGLLACRGLSWSSSAESRRCSCRMACSLSGVVGGGPSAGLEGVGGAGERLQAAMVGEERVEVVLVPAPVLVVLAQEGQGE